VIPEAPVASMPQLVPEIAPALALKLISETARLLFENGQTTHRVVEDVRLLGSALGYRVDVYPTWDRITVRLDNPDGDKCPESLAAPMRAEVEVTPSGVNMSKVLQTTALIDAVSLGQLAPAKAIEQLKQIEGAPSASTIRFILMAGLGAAALAVIFGVTDGLTLSLVFFSASAGAVFRKIIAHYSKSFLLQPIGAAFLAGAFGAAVQSLGIDVNLQFVEACPCMILVPGAHIINASLDLARNRLNLGIARLVYASLIVLMICLGLFLGLCVGGQTLAQAMGTQSVPIVTDVIAAGVAVAAFGAFFSMPWRILIIPVLIGMSAHAMRWSAIEMGYSAPIGVAAACFFAGLVATPLAHRLKIPFAALAFASVVSMMPGVFLFRMSSALVEIYMNAEKSAPSILPAATAEGITAMVICLAIAFGVIVPKLAIDRYFYENK